MILMNRAADCYLWKFVMANNEIYSVSDAVLDSLFDTLHKLSPELIPSLEDLLTSCPQLRSVLRRCVLLLSENLRDKAEHFPLCHIAIASALKQYASCRPHKSTEQFNVRLDRSNHEVWTFTDILALQIMRLCAVQVTARTWSWNIEDAFGCKDYLFRHLVTSGDDADVSEYQIKDPGKLHNDIMRVLLTERVLRNMELHMPKTAEQAEPLQKGRTVIPTFTIVH